MSVFNINEFNPVIYKGRKMLGGECVDIDNHTVTILTSNNHDNFAPVNTDTFEVSLLSNIKEVRFVGGDVHFHVEISTDLSEKKIYLCDEQIRDQYIFVRGSGLLKNCEIVANTVILGDTPMEGVRLFADFVKLNRGFFPDARDCVSLVKEYTVNVKDYQHKDILDIIFPESGYKNLIDAFTQDNTLKVMDDEGTRKVSRWMIDDLCKYFKIPLPNNKMCNEFFPQERPDKITLLDNTLHCFKIGW